MENSVSGGQLPSKPSLDNRMTVSVGGEASNTKQVCHYERVGVFVRFEYASEEFPEDDSYVRGVLTLVETQVNGRNESLHLCWTPREEDDWLMIQSTATASPSPNGALPSPPSSAPHQPNGETNGASPPEFKPQSKLAFKVDLNKVQEVKRINPGMGWPILVVMGLNSQPISPPLEFQNGGVKELYQVMKQFVSIKKSTKDPNVKKIQPRGRDLTQSLSALNVSWAGSATADMMDSRSRDPYSATMDGLTRVKNYVFDSLLPHQKKLKKTRPMSECAVLEDELEGQAGASRIGINNRFEPGYDLVTCAAVGERPVLPERLGPVTEEEYGQMIDHQGRIKHPQAFRNRVFRGGICHNLRPIFWKYLLDYYSCSKTLEENALTRKALEDDYFRMKLQWKTFTDEQLNNFVELREKKALIEKDVIRTDRSDEFFKGSLQENVNLMKLYDILMTYVFYNFDLGYMQGMSDLLAPLLMLLEDEVDAFWCFTGLMRRTCANFDMEDESGMKLQLSQLKYLLNLLDPSFYAFLESKESGNLYFCFRWLLIWFKREFSFHDICTLWEVLWTKVPCGHFHLFVCLSMLDHEKTAIMSKDLDFNEILRHVNQVQYKLDLNKILRNAEAIFLQVKAVEDKLPEDVRKILSPVERSPPSAAAAGENGFKSDAGLKSPKGSNPANDSADLVIEPSLTFSEMYKSVNFTPSLVVPADLESSLSSVHSN